jgi:MFS family permease
MQQTHAAGFRGWWIVAVGFVTQALTVGVTFGSFPVFLVPIAEAFDASLMEVSVGMSVMMFTATSAGVVVGPLLDRYSIRTIMTSGALLQVLCLVLMSQASALWQLGALFGLGIALGVALLGPLASATLVAKWFRRLLGRAQGVTNMGGPAGAGLFSILGGYLVGEVGWRQTLFVYAGMALAVLPLVWLVVRSRPEDIGQWPDGDAEAGPVHAEGDVPPRAATDLLAARAFWLLVLPVGLLMGISSGWGSQVVALGVDLGFENASAANIFGASALLGIFGTLAFGGLADRVAGRRLLWVVMGFHVAGFCLLVALPASASFVSVVPALGFLGGGMMPVYAALIGRLFGPASFGQVMGLGGLMMAPFAVVAPTLGAGLRDETGSYDATLLCFAGGMLLASALLLGLRVPTAGQGSTADPFESGTLRSSAPGVE